MKLIYRALQIEITPRPIPPYVKPHAINWRFQPPGEKFETTPRPISPYVKPRAINWRFQAPTTRQEAQQHNKFLNWL